MFLVPLAGLPIVEEVLSQSVLQEFQLVLQVLAFVGVELFLLVLLVNQSESLGAFLALQRLEALSIGQLNLGSTYFMVLK